MAILDAEIQENVVLNKNCYRAISASMTYAAASIPGKFHSIRVFDKEIVVFTEHHINVSIFQFLDYRGNYFCTVLFL